jgi:hypothetical protein
MMYKNDLVAVLKTNGKILREDGSTVYVPFGSEYSILVKNLRAVKALVSISIDGEDVLSGKKLIVSPNSNLELERFLADALDKGNRFKFIQKTEKIQDYRGDKIDDGIIRIEFQYEKPVEIVNTGWSSRGMSFSKGISHGGDNMSCMRGMGPRGASDTQATFSTSSLNSQLNSPATMDSLDSFTPLADEGITVKGSESDQQFRIGSVGALETQKHVITLQLKGVSEKGNVVEKPVTVDTKKVCKICGTSNKHAHKYCIECGTFLE